MKLTPENVMRVTKRLLDAKQELVNAQAEWDAIFSKKTIDESANASSITNNETVAERIIVYLDENLNSAFTSDAVAQALNANINTIKTTLSRLVGKGVEKRSSSEYGSVKKATPVFSAPIPPEVRQH